MDQLTEAQLKTEVERLRERLTKVEAREELLAKLVRETLNSRVDYRLREILDSHVDYSTMGLRLSLNQTTGI